MSEHSGIDREPGPGAVGGTRAVASSGRYGRRALMLGTVAAAAGAAVSLADGAGIAEAANGQPVELGQNNSATATTWVTNNHGAALTASTSSVVASALTGINTGASRAGSGPGVTGSSSDGDGVYGISNIAAGVVGQGGAVGVSGNAPGGIGAIGESNAGVGVLGESEESIGVCGYSNSGPGVLGWGARARGCWPITQTAPRCRSWEKPSSAPAAWRP